MRKEKKYYKEFKILFENFQSNSGVLLIIFLIKILHINTKIPIFFRIYLKKQNVYLIVINVKSLTQILRKYEKFIKYLITFKIV